MQLVQQSLQDLVQVVILHIYDFYKSRSNTLGTAYVVNDDDHLGAFRFYAADGGNSGYITAAEIYGSCDGGSGSAGDMPGRITFHTRADGAGQGMSEDTEFIIMVNIHGIIQPSLMVKLSIFIMDLKEVVLHSIKTVLMIILI